MAAQLFAKQQGTANYINLTLFDAEPIKLTLSVTNIMDPLAATSVFSQTFRVPHDSVNGPYFKGVFNINSMDFDASKKADAYVVDNGAAFTTGNIRLTNVFTNNTDNSIEYEIIFTGETADFGSKIGGGFLNEIDFTSYNHIKNYTNIINSWTNMLFNGDLVYGLIEWGYDYNSANQPIDTTLSYGFSKSFTDSNNGLQLGQWKPQFRAKAIWDKVFENSGKTYDSVFLNSELFKQIYVITENKAQANAAQVNLFEAINIQNIPDYVGTIIPLTFNSDISDPGNLWNPVTSVYTSPATGLNTFQLTLEFILNTGTEIDVAFIVKMIDADTDVVLSTHSGYITENDTLMIFDISANLQQGQKVKFEWYSQCTGGTCAIYEVPLEFYNLRIKSTVVPQIFALASILPNNVRTIDFMRSIINRFRLVFVPSKEIENHFTITPWKDWIMQGDSVDWSDKQNTDNDISTTPLFYTQSRFNIFKDQEDSDYLNYAYQLEYKQTYGQLNIDSTNELITGTREYKDQFASTPLSAIAGNTELEEYVDSQKFLIPHIAKDSGQEGGDTNVGKREPIQPKLRLVFYNGLKAAPIPWYINDEVSIVAKTTYPLMSNFSEFPVTPSTLDLNWKNSEPMWDISLVGLGNGSTAHTVYNTFWKTWYDTTFDSYSRIVEMEMVLKYTDLINFNFNNYVFIKDAWYFVNEIKDYIVGETSLCKVQLVKVGNAIGLIIPPPPITYTEVQLCTAPTVCEAFCCLEFESAVSNTYWINGLTLDIAGGIFLDAIGTQSAASGIYSDGITAAILNGAGIITSKPSVDECVCLPVSYDYSVETASIPCDLYCLSMPIAIVYSNTNTFEASTFLFLNDALTIPAPIGYYAPTAATSALQVGENGQVLVTVSLLTCDCTIYYPHVVCYSTTLCNSCCCYAAPITIYTNSATFSAGTLIWNDNAGVVPSAIGWYKKDVEQVAVVTTAGTIEAIGMCSECIEECVDGSVNVTLKIEASTEGYNNDATLEKSFDNINWIYVGTLNTTGIEVSQLYTVEENVWVRGTFTSTVNGGTLNTFYKVNDLTIAFNVIATPGSNTIYSTGTVNTLNAYELSAYVDGGIPIIGVYQVSGTYDSYKGNINYNSAISLNHNGTINTSLDLTGGFTKIGAIARMTSSIKMGDLYLFAGDFDAYKGLPVDDDIIALNEDGSINVTFQGNFNPIDNNITLIKISETKFYAWEYRLITSANPRTIKKYNINGTLLSESLEVNGGFNSVLFYNGMLYVASNSNMYGGAIIPPAVSIPSIFRLDANFGLDGTFNTGNAGFNVTPEGNLAIAIADDTIYCIGKFTTYNGDPVAGHIVALNMDGSLKGYFNVGTGFNTIGLGLSSILAQETSIWVGGSFTEYNGIPSEYLIKLNADGTKDNTFDVTTTFSMIGESSPIIYCLRMDDTHILVGGKFDLYKAAQTNGLVRIHKDTAVRDVVFNIGTGFDTVVEPFPGYRVWDINPTLAVPQPIVTYEILTYSSINSACDSYCGIPDVTIYGNGSTLITSTILYSDITGLAPVNQGWYSDGVTIAYVLTNSGVITDVPSASGCNCIPLHGFKLRYDIDKCLSCNAPILATWLNNAVFLSATIAYSNSIGTVFATAGFYSYNSGDIIEVGSNGVIISQDNCFNCIFPLVCESYQILNTGTEILNYNYIGCDDLPYFGTIKPGRTIITACTDIVNFNTTGSTWSYLSISIC